ncbi:MAG: UDP-N-acetylmuramoyl-L-alanyl-D-glutamate--2,6-diaminopimelate ligase, partial [Microgenomates group bacterium Gr01-1014_16]
MNFEKLKNPFRWVRSWFWVMYYGYPARKLTVIAVTGTDGKTTVVNLIYEILKAAGYKTGLVSTVWAKVGDEIIDMGLHVTTPDEEVMQKLFRRMVDAGCTHAVIEVTSHRLAQYKTEGYNIKIAVLTNITHEHLDYHGTFENYRNAKLKLFKNVEYSVLNQDDPSFDVMKDKVTGKLVIYGKGYSFKVSPFLAGEYNEYNIGAAEAVAKIFNVQSSMINGVFKNYGGVPGRREEIRMGQKFRCIVDFAHTPNGLKNLLESLKGKGKLILVFGCTGERDKDKRPIMGKIASGLADIVIVTTDDQRDESQDEIYDMIMSNVQSSMLNKFKREDDRDKAIIMAVKMAKPGDVVVAAGMGHEQTQLIGKTEIRRSDRQAFIMGIHA